METTTLHAINRGMNAVLLLLCGLFLMPQQSHAQQLLLQGSQVYFVKNKGQVFDAKDKPRPDVEYTAESNGIRLFFTKQGVSYVFVEKTPKKERRTEGVKIRNQKIGASDILSDFYISEIKTHKVDMEIIDANPSMTILANQQADHYFNYYLPHSRGGVIEHVPIFRKLVYQNVYKNIDLIFYSADQGIKYDLVVRPGGRVEDIRLKYNGATKLEISQKGALHITTSLGALEEHKPITFQKQDTVVELGRLKKKKKDIKSSFKLYKDEITFNVESFNKNQTLIIDPGVKWFTYLGGSASDRVSSNFAIDSDGNIIIRGITNSINFPVSTTASQTTLGGSDDAFVAKFTRAGKRLWATYYGGNAADATFDWAGTAIDPNGNIYITGATATSSGFPITSGAFQTTYGGGSYDAYIAKFNSDGTRVWATYFGGSNREEVFGIDVDSQGNVVIAGETSSPNLPVSSGAYQSSHAGYHSAFINNNSDAFIAKFSGSGQRLWATYLGTATLGFEIGYTATFDRNDDIIVAGITPGSGFPTTTGVFQASYGGGQWDNFISKFHKNGSLLWSTYYGGSHLEYPAGIAVDTSNKIIVVGCTYSTNFPVSSGAYQTSIGAANSYDSFIVKLDTNGQRQWGSYYGGSDFDYANGVAIDSNNSIWVVGFSMSSNFPVTNDAIQSTNQGNWDATFVKFSSQGQRQWASWYGGAGLDNACGVEIDQGDPIIVGYTASTTLSVSPLAFQPTFGGGDSDGFIIRLGTCSIDTPVLSNEGMPQACQAPSSTIELDAGNYDEYLWSNGVRTRVISIDQDGTYWVIVKDENGCTATSAPITIDIP